MKYENERIRVKLFLEGKWLVRKGFTPIDTSSGIKWNYQHSNNPATYQTYMHSLGILNDLMRISQVDHNTNLEKKARDLILDWHSIDHSKGKNYAWKEHPVSSRINNIIYFQSRAEKYKLSKKIFDKLIIEHCNYLSKETNYKFNNHGLMMDNALINAASFLSDNDLKQLYIEKALYRIRYAMQRDFSRQGVHLENSPEYHRMIIMIYKNIEKKLKELKIPLGKQETAILKLAQQFRNFIIQPNQVYPMIGDTGSIPDTRIKKNFNDFHDTEAGITIFHNYNQMEPEKSSMMIFKAGYYNKTHKHYDDLSTYLYLNGEELLIDSGKYSYSGKDPIRKHIISPKGHNTVNLSGQDYQLVDPLREQFKLKLAKRMIKSQYKMISGINKLYKNSTLTRYSILTKEDVCIIIDRVVSKENKATYQNFNINEDATIEKIDELTYEILLNNKKFSIKTFERNASTIESKIAKGYISRKFGEYNHNERILYKQNNKNTTYITAIYSKDEDIEIDYINLRLSKLTYSINGKEVTIEL